MNESMRVETSDKKYTVVSWATGRLHAMRNGKEWRDCTGDKLIYQLAADLQEQREEVAQLRKALELKLEGTPSGLTVKQADTLLKEVTRQRDLLKTACMKECAKFSFPDEDRPLLHAALESIK